MIKTVKFSEDHSVELNGSMGWLFVYRAQFGRDILPELMPVIEAFMNIVVEALSSKEFEGIENVDIGDLSVEDIFKRLDSDVIGEALATLSGIELMTVIRIAWAMAKNADRKTEPPEKWANKFEVFPLDEIIPEIFSLILESSISTKNSQSLLGMIGKLSLSKK